MEVDLTEDLSASSSMAAANASSSTLDQVNSLKIQFCMLSVHSPFIDKFTTQLAAARKRRQELPEGCSPPPMVEMDAIFKAEERMAAEQAETKVEVANGAGVASSGGDQTDHKLRIIFGLGDSEGLWSEQQRQEGPFLVGVLTIAHPLSLRVERYPLRPPAHRDSSSRSAGRQPSLHRLASCRQDRRRHQRECLDVPAQDVQDSFNDWHKLQYRFSMADVKGAHKVSLIDDS